MVPANASDQSRDMACSSPPLTPAEGQLRDGKSLAQLFDGGTLVSQSFAQSLLQSILSSVESRDPGIACGSAEGAADPVAPVSSRLVPYVRCCGCAAGASCQNKWLQLDYPVGNVYNTSVQRDLLPLAESLCQDPDPKVRSSVCCQLGALTRSVGLGLTKQYLMPCLLELSGDGDCAVRRAALEATITMLGLLDDGDQVGRCANQSLAVGRFGQNETNLSGPHTQAILQEFWRKAAGL
ncbi:hypothetical protein HPB51_012458 [Rhipicephalus microplus]|uniref:Uncharacterized protein n=1 Tax=Rhipicephalus microplus TaxID=6941 RepID=A0A9J6E9I4_RHIMP|nr:hypothetical protein HPB51_012458 [Rhipicephalus microplus]